MAVSHLTRFFFKRPDPPPTSLSIAELAGEPIII